SPPPTREVLAFARFFYCRLPTADRRLTPVFRRVLCVIALIAFAASARANELIVDHRRLQLNDLLTITLSVEGTFASAGEMNIPLSNLAIVGEPSVSSEFAWFNGEVTRRKVFRYRARALAPGPARVGPLVLDSGDGQRETLPAIAIEVLPDRISGSNDARVVLEEMLAAGRDPLFVVAEMDKQSASVGEPVTVTWWLYNAAVVQQWQIAAVPKLVEFWSEELSRNETPERMYIGDRMVQRLPIRRAVLFPLQSGRLRIGGMSVQASVLRRTRGSLAMIEGELSETTFTSAAIDLDVQAIPAGPPVDAIGDLALRCEPLQQKNGGPVVMRVRLSGLGNVRAATPPQFEGPIAGRMQIEGGEVTVVRDEGAFAMSRQWRYLIFPEQSGMFAVPPLAMRIFDPAAGTRRDLRCATSFVNAVAARVPEAPLPTVKPSARPLPWPWIGGVLALLLAVLVALPRMPRELSLRRAVREIVRDASPAEIRARIESRVPIDLREASERGDALRALRSLLDAADRDRDIAIDSEREIERRVREVLECLR
nr:BatD family protein [Acidobacteriota bacterium]